MGGIPKFCLPIKDDCSLLEWHVNLMRQCCDRIRICTRSNWIPIVQQMDLSDVELLAIEPSTMTDAVMRMQMGSEHRYVIGMPDTFIHQSDSLFYQQIAQSPAAVTLAVWPCHEELRGRVGQIGLAPDGRVTAAMDKAPGCELPLMWGAMAIDGTVVLDRKTPHPGVQIPGWMEAGLVVAGVRAVGTYLDVGTVAGLKLLYRVL
jgi:hypothetical protein